MPGQDTTGATRAIAAYDAMQRALYIDDGRGLYLEEATRGSAVAFVWPFSRALLGTLCLAGVPEHGAAYRRAATSTTTTTPGSRCRWCSRTALASRAGSVAPNSCFHSPRARGIVSHRIRVRVVSSGCSRA